MVVRCGSPHAYVGSNSSSRCIVMASSPVDSASRLAARPVGAHNNTLACLALTIFNILFTVVVFPTPGPP